jgi:restriction system protein
MWSFPQMPVFLGSFRKTADLPSLVLNGLLEFSDKTHEGTLIQSVQVPWFKIIEMIKKDPEGIYQIDPFKWEEIIAGAYVQEGFDEVTLTPRSGDKGRDVIATINGVGSIRIINQVKAYRPGHVVPANDVRALVGVLDMEQNVSKGVITTTSQFAPRVMEDEFIKRVVPYRLELMPRDVLLPWLEDAAKKNR